MTTNNIRARFPVAAKKLISKAIKNNSYEK